ncbi:hypothetical protein BBJ28_00009480 [Nothophytophthora sp. Chile5]|nr:hypothetical protein BBJ28_00009480 [Nothophytophthora sp. Chile5]
MKMHVSAAMALRLRQLQIIHRHGDRTPLLNVFRGGAGTRAEQEEALLWERQLPGPEQLAHLREKYSVHLGGGVQASFQHRPFGYLTTTGIHQMTARGNRLLPLAGVAPSEVQIFSNTYTRTQLSAQALLSGLLRDQQQLKPPVSVFPPETDIINTYAAFPEIMDLKKELERDNAEFAAREHEMAPCKQELMRLLPVFDTGKVPFTWMAATDYFVCRRAHQVPYIPGTEVHGHATERHLGFRFHQMQKALWDHRERKKLVIYSGHDVSLLAVLRAIDAEIADDIDWWPEYSSALALELLEDESGKYFVRARLNGEILVMREAAAGLCTSDHFRGIVADRIGKRAE